MAIFKRQAPKRTPAQQARLDWQLKVARSGGYTGGMPVSEMKPPATDVPGLWLTPKR